MSEIKLLAGDFEEVACLNCASDQYVDYDYIEWKEQILHYRLCKNCGLKYMSPRPTQAWYHNYYKVGFWQELLVRNAFQDKGNQFHVKKKEQILKQKVLNNRRRANRIKLILKSLINKNKELKILEIGAGFGQTLKLFREKFNADVFAIEPNEETRDYLKSIEVPVVGRYAEELNALPKDNKFDLIITSHVLENISNPFATLKMISNHLYDDGLYFLDTTNMYYRNDANPYHMLIFTPESVKNMLNRAGFNIVKSHFEDCPEKIENTDTLKTLDPYLSVVCSKERVKTIKLEVDVESIINNQKLGERYFKKLQKRELVVHNRIDRRVVNKLRRIFNIPIPVLIGKQQN